MVILITYPHVSKSKKLQVQNLRELPCWCCHRSTVAIIPTGDLLTLHPIPLYDQLACTKCAAGTAGYHQ